MNQPKEVSDIVFTNSQGVQILANDNGFMIRMPSDGQSGYESWVRFDHVQKHNKQAFDYAFLLETVQRYAGWCERRIRGRPPEVWNCDGYNWIKRVKKPSFFERVFFKKEDHIEYVFVALNNVGMVEFSSGPQLAEEVLKEIGEL